MRPLTQVVEPGMAGGFPALHGWKLIAKFMGVGVRTAQRWEAWGLPVRRPLMGNRANVVAIPEEIQSWLKAAPVNLVEEVNRLKNEITRLEDELKALRADRSPDAIEIRRVRLTEGS